MSAASEAQSSKARRARRRTIEARPTLRRDLTLGPHKEDEE